ncbi:MAG: poly-gamma-glutamate synthase PgsB [Deltaproteobacteria bacterium]|nr:MAG: poly-gamma-glutamate synthase PgsB [Deltaproteobacteria bacterium]
MFETIIILLGLVVIFLFIECRVHLRNLNSIPIRIHVNGTRGKSSVTRLIAGALREHGLKTFAKTTGTLPRMIMDDGREYPIYRPAGANIIEQLRILSLAAHNEAEALVIECMAVQPRLQSLTELKFIRATHGVITNARADHLDIMGPTERDVTLALLGTVPCDGKLFTAELDYLKDFQEVCKDRKTELHIVEEGNISEISDQDMAGFSYVEHKENVALVLKVCASLGIPRDAALRGMWKTQRDPGAMSEHEIDFFGRRILFVNGFAANDPESSERIWRMALEAHQDFDRQIMVLSARADRPDRSKQLGEAIVHWPQADRYVLMGSGVYVLFRTAVASGVDSSKFVYAEGLATSQIFEEIVGISGESAMVMGIGNIVGPGLDLVNYFRNRTILQ